MVYIKISLPGSKAGFVETPEQAKVVIDSMVNAAETNDDDMQEYTFSVVEMTPKEFEALPEFEGF